MPSLAEGGHPRSGSQSIALSALVLIVVCGLFFAPDLLKFFSGIFSSKTKVEKEVDSFRETISRSLSLDSGNEEKQSTLRRAQDGGARAAGAPIQRSDLLKAASSSQQALELQRNDREYMPGPDTALEMKDIDRRATAELERQERLQELAKEQEEQNILYQLNWGLLRLGSTGKTLKKSGLAAKDFAVELPESAVATKRAVDGYVAVLRQALEGSGNAIEARDVPEALGQANTIVIQSIEKEKLSAEWAERWTTIGISKEGFFALFPTGTFKTLKPFQPRFSIVSLRFYQRSAPQGAWDPKLPARLDIEGEASNIEGRDVRLEVKVKNRVIAAVNLQNDIYEPTRKMFRLQLDAGFKNTLVHLVIADEYNRKYERVYNFYPRVNRFVWNGFGDNFYQIPFEKGDPRLDRFFLIHEGVVGAPRVGSSNLGTF